MTTRHWSFYALGTGEFTGKQISTNDETLVSANTPSGCGVKEGTFNRNCWKVSLATNVVEAKDPVPPASTDYWTWVWNAESEEWDQVPTLLMLKANRVSQVDGDLLKLEAQQGRPIREINVALAAGEPVPTVAQDRLDAIEAKAVELRGVRATLLACTTKAELDAITWSLE